MLRSFVKDFLLTQSYNEYLEPISNYTGFLTFLAIFLVLVITIVLVILLNYKKKPWKIYLVVLLEYVFVLAVFLYINSYFYNFDEYSTLKGILAGRDLLLLCYIPQYVVFIILGIRALGIDLKKFGFKEDAEYLDIKEEDREEFEVNIEFDKEKTIRTFKKFWRNARYVYLEHRFVCNTLVILFFAGGLFYTYYYFGILHKTYREGSIINANSYQIKINNSYLTDRTTQGDMIDPHSKYAYVIINMTVKNNGSRRTINVDRFRLMNKNKQFLNTMKYYSYFTDLGTAYEAKDILPSESRTFSLVYRVDKTLDPNKYVLYYQDLNASFLIKKTKLNMQDVRQIETIAEKKLGQEMILPTEEDLTITSSTIALEREYSTYKCGRDGCGITNQMVKNEGGYILELSFASDHLETKSFIDILLKYVKIKYEDKDGKIKEIVAQNAINRDYTGNVAYLKLPGDSKLENVKLIFTFRNKRYIYQVN